MSFKQHRRYHSTILLDESSDISDSFDPQITHPNKLIMDLKYSELGSGFGDCNWHHAEPYNRGLGQKLIEGNLFKCCKSKQVSKASTKPHIAAPHVLGGTNHINLGQPIDMEERYRLMTNGHIDNKQKEHFPKNKSPGGDARVHKDVIRKGEARPPMGLPKTVMKPIRLDSSTSSSDSKYMTSDVIESRTTPRPPTIVVQKEDKHINVYNTIQSKPTKPPLPEKEPTKPPLPEKVIPPTPVVPPCEPTKPKNVFKEPLRMPCIRPCEPPPRRVMCHKFDLPRENCRYRHSFKEFMNERATHKCQPQRRCSSDRTNQTHDYTQIDRMSRMLKECADQLEQYKDGTCHSRQKEPSLVSESYKNQHVRCPSHKQTLQGAREGDSYDVVKELFQSLSNWIRQHNTSKPLEVPTSVVCDEIALPNKVPPYFNIEMYQMKCGKERIVINKI